VAQHFWPNSDPMGRRMYFPGDPKDLLKIDEHTQWMTVIALRARFAMKNLDGSGAAVGRTIFQTRSRLRIVLRLL